MSEEESVDSGPVESDILNTVDHTTFGEDDWNIVINECSSLSANWEQLSSCLGLPYRLIAAIKANHPNDNYGCWSDALNQWISQNYNTDRFGVPSWRTLLKAVAKVDQLMYKKLAKAHQKVATNHQPGSSSTNPVQARLQTADDFVPTAKRICLDATSLPDQQYPLSVHRNPQPQPTWTPIEIFAGYLRSLYKSRKLPVYGKWPPTPSKQFINLAVILKEKVSRASADDFTKATLRGKSDDILQKKKSIQFSDLAKTKDGEPAQLVLVEGAPGIGKSTFAWEGCRKWGAGEILQQYKLMVLLRLREKRVQQAKTINDLVRYSRNADVKQKVVEEIENSDGAGVLLVLEGFDELPAQLRKDNSLFMDIIKGEMLTEATILITSRHWASRPLLLNDELHRPLSQHIEILGFTRKDIEDYLECMPFDDPSLLSGLQKYLSCYPNIASMMYVPLNCAIVLEVYRENRSDVNQLIPKTMTELYTSLVRTLLIRYLQDHPKYRDKCTRLSSFQDLPEFVYEQFCRLARLAYEGICNDEQIIFSDLPGGFETLGLMQCVPELYVDHGAVVSYNFLHLTLQEYLAAYHVSLMTDDTQIDHFLKAMNSMMMEFIAGLTRLDFEHEKLAHLSRFVGDKDDEYWDMSLFHWLFEAQNASLLQQLTNVDIITFSNNDGLYNIGNRGALDYYVLGYCISHSNCKWNIVLLNFNNEEHEMFIRGAANCNALRCGKILSLEVISTDFKSVPFTTLPSCLLCELTKFVTMAQSGWNDLAHLVMQTPQLNELVLNLCAFPPGSAVQLFNSLSSLNSFTSLQLRASNETLYAGGLHSEDCKALGRLLSTSKSLTNLDIHGHLLKDQDIEYISSSLKQSSSTLYHLNISGCDIDSNGAQHIADGLYFNDTLRELHTSFNPLGDSGAFALAQMLTRNKVINVLDLRRCSITEVGANHFAKVLHTHDSSLRILNLGHNGIKDEGASALAEMLTRNHSLHYLNLQQCSITPVGARKLARALCVNSAIKDFNLMNNQLANQGALAFAEVLTKNRSLKTLDVQNCGITEFGAMKLAKALRTNVTLTDINLKDNAIKDEGANALAQMLKSNQSLRMLCVDHYSITDIGAKDLIRAQAISTNHNIVLWLNGTRCSIVTDPSLLV